MTLIPSRHAWACLQLTLIWTANIQAGELTTRMQLTLDRVTHGGPPSYTEDFVLADAVPQHVRRFTEFSGDVSGRYLGALAAVSQYNDRNFPELDRIAAKIVTLQKEDGHFGDPLSTQDVTTSDMATLWGNGRLLIGLMEYYQLHPTPEVLACARRLGDCLVKLGPRFNDSAVMEKFSGDQIAVGYICWTQIIEGLVELGRVTREPNYLNLAGQIADNTHRYPKQHSHGFVSALRGILDLYRVTHDAKWLQKVESEWEGILASGNLFPQGALPEVFKPLQPDPRDEGCAEADWLRFNLSLWTETRNLRYLENAELTLFNEFYLNQFHTGDFGHHVLSNEGYAAGGARAWWCCTFHGLRAFPEVLGAAFHSDPAGLSYDLPVDGRISNPSMALQADSTLAQDATATLTVTRASDKDQTLRLRQPAWASALDLVLNHQPLAASLEIHRRWKSGDVLAVHYRLRTRVQEHPQDAGRFALLRGPWMLGVDGQNSPTFFDEDLKRTRLVLPVRAANGDVALAPAPIPKDGVLPPLVVPTAHLSVPYLPGGYPCQPQSVTLRPISENTTVADGTPWVFWFEAAK